MYTLKPEGRKGQNIIERAGKEQSVAKRVWSLNGIYYHPFRAYNTLISKRAGGRKNVYREKNQIVSGESTFQNG